MILRARPALLAIVLAMAGGATFPLSQSQARDDAVPYAHELHPDVLVAETSSGEKQIRIEIADEADERSVGLMFRHELAEDLGLLFVFDRTGRQSFWMRNTPLPLDLLFIAENGRVAAIRQGEPFSEAMISPEAPARFVLELNRGTAAKLGIRIGTRLRHPIIDAFRKAQ